MNCSVCVGELRKESSFAVSGEIYIIFIICESSESFNSYLLLNNSKLYFTQPKARQPCNLTWVDWKEDGMKGWILSVARNFNKKVFSLANSIRNFSILQPCYAISKNSTDIGKLYCVTVSIYMGKQSAGRYSADGGGRIEDSSCLPVGGAHYPWNIHNIAINHYLFALLRSAGHLGRVFDYTKAHIFTIPSLSVDNVI